MSSCPGPTLEDYLSWYFDVFADSALVALFEPYRESIENGLEDYLEEDGRGDAPSWRAVGSYYLERAPADVIAAAKAYVKGMGK